MRTPRLAVALGALGLASGLLARRPSRPAPGAAERLETDLLASVSHELRTPLTSICGYAELLGETELDEQQQHFLTVIERSADRLSRVVSDLIVAAAFSRSTPYWQAQSLEPAAALANLLADYRLRFADRGLALESAIEAPACLVDGERLAQLADHLLANALKFTVAGGARLAVDHDGQILRLTVSDSGPGVAAGELALLAGRFYRSEQARREEAPGLGLGLYICRALVESQGGSLRLEPADSGSGLTATVELPAPLA